MAKYRFDQIAINSTEKKKPTEEDRFTYLGLEHLDSGSLKVTRYGSEVAPIGEKLVMRKGDVLFGKRRAYQKKVAIAPFDGIFSAHGMVLRPKEDVIDRDFFPLFISSDYFLDAAIKISVGSLSPTINWRDLKELEFELPDLSTQKRLAAVLWAMNETMDSYKALISATDELVKSQFMERFGDPETNPKSLPTVPLGDLAFVTKLAGFEYTKYIKYQDHGDVIMIRGLNCKSGKLVLDDIYWINKDVSDILPRSKLEAGDLVLTYVGTVGEVAIIDKDDTYHLAPNVAKISLIDKSRNIPYFWDYMLMISRDYILRYASTTTQSSLSMERIRKIPFIVPDTDSQRHFVSMLKQSDKSKFELEQALSELTATYKSIIAENLG